MSVYLAVRPVLVSQTETGPSRYLVGYVVEMLMHVERLCLEKGQVPHHKDNWK